MISKSTTEQIAREARRQIGLEIEHQERIGDPDGHADELREVLELDDSRVLIWASVMTSRGDLCRIAAHDAAEVRDGLVKACDMIREITGEKRDGHLISDVILDFVEEAKVWKEEADRRFKVIRSDRPPMAGMTLGGMDQLREEGPVYAKKGDDDEIS